MDTGTFILDVGIVAVVGFWIIVLTKLAEAHVFDRGHQPPKPREWPWHGASRFSAVSMALFTVVVWVWLTWRLLAILFGHPAAYR